jgi:hypothetical protein
MNITMAFVRLYPRPMRERWDIQTSVETSVQGWRQLPDLLRGIADSWLHPTFWPATAPAQRRRRATTTAVTLTFLCWLAGHVLLEQDPLLPTTLTHAWPLTAIDLLALTGLATIAPLPRLTVATVRRTAVLLAPPGILGAAVVVVANSSYVPAGPPRVLILACWWIALISGGVQACRLVADVDGVTPGPARLRLGLSVLLLAAAAMAAVTSGFALALHDAYAAAAAAGITAMALVVLATAQDVHEVGAFN